MRKTRTTSLILATLLTAPLHIFAATPTPDCGRSLRQDNFVAANNKLGLKLLASQFAADIKSKPNILISSLGLSVALGMVAHGAAGETQNQISQLIGIQYDTDNKEVTGLLETLTSLPGGEKVRLGKSIWADKSRFEFSPEYAKQIGSPALARDFANTATVDEINSLVKDQSGGMIPKVMQEIPPHVMAILVNVLFFQAPWLNEFSYFTQDAPFYKRDGTQMVVPTMRHGDLRAAYLQNDKVQMVSLEFAALQKSGEYTYPLPSRFVLDVLLPKGSIDDFLTTFKTDDYLAWLNAAKPATIELTIPKFKLAYGSEYGQPIANLGVTDIFDSAKAQLGPMGQVKSGANLMIDSIVQQVAVEMDEKGFKAAAATAVMGGAVSMPQIEHSMHVDRPFVFLLRDRISGLVMFQGAVTNPKP